MNVPMKNQPKICPVLRTSDLARVPIVSPRLGCWPGSTLGGVTLIGARRFDVVENQIRIDGDRCR